MRPLRLPLTLPRNTLTAIVVAAALAGVGLTSLRAQPTATGLALVANQASGSTTIIELPSGRTTEVAVGDGPHEVAILPGARRGVVTINGVAGVPGHHLAIIDLRERHVSRSIDHGPYTRPHGVVPVPGRPNLVAVTSETTRNVLLVNVETGTIERVIPTNAAGSHMVALPISGAAASARAYTANIGGGSTSELDITSGALQRVLPVSMATEGIAATQTARKCGWEATRVARSPSSTWRPARSSQLSRASGFRIDLASVRMRAPQ